MNKNVGGQKAQLRVLSWMREFICLKCSACPMEKVKPPQWDQIHKLSLSQQGDHMTLQFLLWNTRLYYRKFLLFFLHFGIEWQGKFWPFFVIWDLPDFGPLMIEFFFTISPPQCSKITKKVSFFIINLIFKIPEKIVKSQGILTKQSNLTKF